MTKSSRPPRRALRVVLILLGVVAALALAAGEVVKGIVRKDFKSVRGHHTDRLTANLEQFCEAHAALEAEPLFQRQGRTADAGPLLERWVPWADEVNGAADPASDSPLRLPLPHADARAELEDWLSSRPERDLDFAWMKRLRTYDHWDLTNHPAFSTETIDYVNVGAPDFILLQTWAKYRLLSALRHGDYLEASEDVRALARLAHSTGLLIGTAAASAILRLEHAAHGAAVAPPGEWTPVSEPQLERLQAVAFGSVSFNSPFTPVGLSGRARACGVLTRCAGLVEAAAVARLISAYPPGELSAELQALERAVHDGSCPLAQRIWARGMTLQDTERFGARPNRFRALPAWYFGSTANRVMVMAVPSSARLEELPKKLRALRSASAPLVSGEPAGR